MPSKAAAAEPPSTPRRTRSATRSKPTATPSPTKRAAPASKKQASPAQQRSSTPSKSSSRTRTPTFKADVDSESDSDEDDRDTDGIPTPRQTSTSSKAAQPPSTPTRKSISHVSHATPKLTSTPRRYPLLNKEFEVSEQFVDKKGNLSFHKMTHRPPVEAPSPSTKSKASRVSLPGRADVTTPLLPQQSHYIAPIPGSALYTPRKTVDEDQPSLILRALLLVILFASAVVGVWTLYHAMPPIDAADKIHVKYVPSTSCIVSLISITEFYWPI